MHTRREGMRKRDRVEARRWGLILQIGFSLGAPVARMIIGVSAFHKRVHIKRGAGRSIAIIFVT